MYFPQVLEWFSTPDTAVVGQLLKKWPTLEQLQQAPAKQVARLLQTSHISESRIKELAQLIQQAVSAVTDRAV